MKYRPGPARTTIKISNPLLSRVAVRKTKAIKDFSIIWLLLESISFSFVFTHSQAHQLTTYSLVILYPLAVTAVPILPNLCSPAMPPMWMVRMRENERARNVKKWKFRFSGWRQFVSFRLIRKNCVKARVTRVNRVKCTTPLSDESNKRAPIHLEHFSFNFVFVRHARKSLHAIHSHTPRSTSSSFLPVCHNEILVASIFFHLVLVFQFPTLSSIFLRSSFYFPFAYVKELAGNKGATKFICI